MPKGISIIVPVGPAPEYRQYLMSCLKSIVEQMESSDEIVLVDDMAHLPIELDAKGRMEPLLMASIPVRHVYERNKWLLGCSASWNVGVALASNEWCILMGSDDELLPECLESCRRVIENSHDPLGYYNLTCQIDTGEVVTAHNNAALVSKTLWRHTGGFPVAASAGAPDACLISMLLGNEPEHLQQVREGYPLYWVRTHEAQNTRLMAGPYSDVVIQIRNVETARFKPDPEWAR
jgi:glycosyltransferase involved in cell wall biosynthesis